MSKKKKSKRAKIVSKLLNNRYFVVGCAVVLFLILCGILLFVFNYTNSVNSFKVKDRIENIQKAKLDDKEGYSTFAWVRVQGTNIDYPVIYAPGADVSKIISDFAWSERKFDTLPNSVFLSGHNVKNLSKNPFVTDRSHKRFEQLMSFTYLDFVKNNQFIQFTLNGENYIYKIYSVSYPIADSHENIVYNELDSDDFNKYVKQTVRDSIFDFNVDVNENDKIISLITCTRVFGFEREFNVSARLLRDGEKTSLSKVETTSNFEEVENAMKGDVKYEES